MQLRQAWFHLHREDVPEEETDRKELSRHIKDLIIACDVVASVAIGAPVEKGVEVFKGVVAVLERTVKGGAWVA